VTTGPAFIASMAQAAIEAQHDLADAIREACPAGHSHAYVQHRDRKPAWCEACGYAEDGTRVRCVRELDVEPTGAPDEDICLGEIDPGTGRCQTCGSAAAPEETP
jgi:hypothetical protein